MPAHKVLQTQASVFRSEAGAEGSASAPSAALLEHGGVLVQVEEVLVHREASSAYGTPGGIDRICDNWRHRVQKQLQEARVCKAQRCQLQMMNDGEHDCMGCP